MNLDELLCDPPPEIARRLIGELMPDEADRYASCPEGVSIRDHEPWTLTVAWWTGPNGRRWLRRTRLPTRAFMWRPEREEEMPPLCHIAPGRAFVVSRGDGRERTLVACPCGEVGTPESTLWMGDRCGACHDYREEGDTTLPPDVPALHEFASCIDALAFAPGGVVYVSSDADVFRLNLRDGSRKRLWSGRDGDQRPPIYKMSVSPDGRFLAAVDFNANVRVIETATRRSSSLHSPVTSWWMAGTPVFSPDGDELFLPSRSNSSRVYRRSAGWSVSRTDAPPANAAAYSPDGGTVYTAHTGGVYAFDRRTWAARPVGDFGSGDLAPAELWAAGDKLVLLSGDADLGRERLGVFRPAVPSDIVMGSDLEALASGGPTPGGDYLFGVVEGAWTFFRLDDLSTAATIGTGAPFPPEPACLSPDDGLCAAAVGERVLLVFPWRALVEAPA